jgi:hypothetical protein
MATAVITWRHVGSIQLAFTCDRVFGMYRGLANVARPEEDLMPGSKSWSTALPVNEEETKERQKKKENG